MGDGIYSRREVLRLSCTWTWLHRSVFGGGAGLVPEEEG